VRSDDASEQSSATDSNEVYSTGEEWQ